MAESDDQNQQLAATLRNRRTTVEDAESDSDVATTTATSVSSTIKPSSSAAAASKKDTEEEDKKKKLTATQVHKRIAQQQGTKKNSQLKNLVISLFIASLGVLLKSAFEKFIFTGREIAIEQTVGLQGNCFKTACKLLYWACLLLGSRERTIEEQRIHLQLFSWVDIPGPADIEISDHDQLAFVSSDDYSWKKESRFFHRPSSKTAKNGGIYTLALNVRRTSLLCHNMNQKMPTYFIVTKFSFFPT